MAQVNPLLRFLCQHRGSDLHLAAGLEPRARVRGSLVSIEGSKQLSADRLRGIMKEIAPPRHWEGYRTDGDADFAYSLEGVARFRVNYFVQENGPGAVFRVIPDEILPLSKLNMPAVIESFAHLNAGLVLVTGPTGSGKSTTLAAIIDVVNTEYARHIITIEDPIEFVHSPKSSIISQREVGEHTESFATALRAAIRQNPDVVLVGEMRDRETIGLAITAAEMGSLVFGTLHTNSAAKTIDRLIDAFPAEEQAQARISLSESLAGVVSQLLLPTADGKGRCAATEILIKTSALPNLIREANTPMLYSLIQGGQSKGMQTMDDALAGLVKGGKVLPEDAYRKAQDKARFEKLLPADEQLDLEV